MTEVSSIADKVRHLHVELEKVTAERETLERQLSRLKRRVVELSEQNETVGGQLRVSRGTEGSLQTNQDLLSTKSIRLESELTKLRKEHQTAKSQLADSQAELDLLRKENDSLRSRLFKSESGYKKFSSENEQLETALSELQDRFALTAKSNDTASTELEKTGRERDLFRVEIDQLSRQLRGRTLKILTIAGVIAAIAYFAIWANYTLSGRAISAKFDGAQTKISSLGEAIDGHLEKLSEQETALKRKDEDIRKLEKTLSKLQTELESLNGMILALKDQKDDRIKMLGENISSLNDENEEKLEAARNKRATEISDLNRKIGNMAKQIKSLMRTRAIAIPPLIAAIDHPSMKTRNAAIRSLEKLTGRKYGAKQEKWDQWWLQNRLKYLGLERR